MDVLVLLLWHAAERKRRVGMETEREKERGPGGEKERERVRTNPVFKVPLALCPSSEGLTRGTRTKGDLQRQLKKKKKSYWLTGQKKERMGGKKEDTQPQFHKCDAECSELAPAANRSTHASESDGKSHATPAWLLPGSSCGAWWWGACWESSLQRLQGNFAVPTMLFRADLAVTAGYWERSRNNEDAQKALIFYLFLQELTSMHAIWNRLISVLVLS